MKSKFREIWERKYLIIPLLIALGGLFLTAMATAGGANRLLGNTVGLTLTFIVLVFLIVLSWLITEPMLRRKKSWWLALGVYLIMVGFCWFFSFSSYLMKSTVNSGAVYADFERTLVSLGRIPVELENQIRDQILKEEENLKNSPIIGNYVDGIIALEMQLGQQPQDISQRITTVLNKARAQRDKLAEKVNDLGKKVEDTTALLKTKKQEHKETEDTVSELTKNFDEVTSILEQELDKKNKNSLSPDGPASEILPDEVACQINRRTGEGECAVALGELKERLEGERDKTKRQARHLVTDINALELQVKDLETDLALSNQNFEANKLEVDNLAQSERLSPSELLPAKVQAFKESPSRERHKTLKIRCMNYLKIFGSSDIEVCAGTQVISLFDKLDQRKKNLDNLNTTCEKARKNLDKYAHKLASDARHNSSGINPDIHNAAFNQIQSQVIDPCLEEARNLSINTDAIEEGISQFRRELDPEVDSLERTGRQFYKVLTGQSREVFHYIAFFISLIQELLLLGAKLLLDFLNLLRLSKVPVKETNINFSNEDVAVAGLLLNCCVEKNRGLILSPSMLDDVIERAQRPLVDNLIHTLEKAGRVSLTGFFRKRKSIDTRGRDMLYNLQKKVLAGEEPLGPTHIGDLESPSKPEPPDDNSGPDNNAGVAEGIISPIPNNLGKSHPQGVQRELAAKPTPDPGKERRTRVPEQTSPKSKSEQTTPGSNKPIYPRVLYDPTLVNSNSDASGGE